MAMQRGKPGRGWRKTQFAQGEICRATGVVGKGEGRSRSSGRAVSQRTGGNCIAIVSVRPVVLKRPERVESAAWLLLSSSYAAVVMGRPALMLNSNRYAKGQRSRSTAPTVSPIGKGTPGTPCCFRLPPPSVSPLGRESAWDRDTW